MILLAAWRDYDDIIKRAKTAGGVEIVGEARGRPILRVSVGSDDALDTILVLAGTHGDEPAGVEAALRFVELTRDAPRDGLRFEVVPCLNPYGYVHNERLDRRGIDLNWSFHREELPEIRALRRIVTQRRFRAVVDLHEDWESSGYYVYEMWRDGAPIGEEITRRVAEVCPINTNPQIEGDAANHGVIHPDPLAARRQARGHGVPIALFLEHTDRYFTSETPTRRPLDNRAKAHLVALNTVIEHYS